MPIYEFYCDFCDRKFEELLKTGFDFVTCPNCDNSKARRIFSRFAMSQGKSSGDRRSYASSKCSGCSASSCASCSI